MSFDAEIGTLRSHYLEITHLMNERNQVVKGRKGGKIHEIDAKLQEICSQVEPLLKKVAEDPNDASTHFLANLKDRIKALHPEKPPLSKS